MELRKLPDPILKQKAKKVTRFGPPLERIFKQMQEVMMKEGGIGLAAPQVGLSIRAVIVGKPGIFMANPVIVAKNKDVCWSKEACLSCPEIGEVEVLRFTRVTVEFQRVNGSKTRQIFDGMGAFVCAHELDHLEGQTLEDYVRPNS